jgi:hypothetical protein
LLKLEERLALVLKLFLKQLLNFLHLLVLDLLDLHLGLHVLTFLLFLLELEVAVSLLQVFDVRILLLSNFLELQVVAFSALSELGLYLTLGAV